MSMSARSEQRFADRGGSEYGSEYGGEAVTQLVNAPQCELLSEQADASRSQVVAALVHDPLHNLLHDAHDELTVAAGDVQ